MAWVTACLAIEKVPEVRSLHPAEGALLTEGGAVGSEQAEKGAEQRV